MGKFAEEINESFGNIRASINKVAETLAAARKTVTYDEYRELVVASNKLKDTLDLNMPSIEIWKVK